MAEEGRTRVHTGPVRGVLPHLADQLRHRIPVVLASRIVELLNIARGFGCVGLRVGGGQCQRQLSGSNGAAIQISSLEFCARSKVRSQALWVLTMMPGFQAVTHYVDLLWCRQDMRTQHCQDSRYSRSPWSLEFEQRKKGGSNWDANGNC